MRYGFVIDQTTCIGCHACTVACKTEHQVPLGVNRTWVKYVEQGTWPDTKRSFSVMRCNHCTDAPCVTICPTSALFKRKNGIVDFDTSNCIGCKSCMQACPYDALYIDPDDHTAQKCNYCAHRVEVGIEPACVVVCPEQSIVAGDLDDPTSKIAQMVAAGNLSQRAVERETKPNLWYKGAQPANIEPLAASRSTDGGIWRDPMDINQSWLNVDLTTNVDGERTGMNASGVVATDDAGAPRVVYANEFPMPWGWRVSTYFLTKAMSAGIAIAAAMALLFDSAMESMWGVLSSDSLWYAAMSPQPRSSAMMITTFGLLAPGTRVPYHYHNKRESVITVISGQGIEIMDGEEIPISTGDVFFIPAGVKHTTVNNSNADLRYLEFFTQPPGASDFVEVTP